MQKYVKFTFNNGYISSNCGYCSNGISVNTSDGSIYEYSKYCPKCGKTVSVRKNDLDQVNKIKIAYENGVKKGKDKQINSNVKSEIKNIVENNLRNEIEKVINDITEDYEILDKEINDLSKTVKKTFMSTILKKIINKN